MVRLCRQILKEVGSSGHDGRSQRGPVGQEHAPVGFVPPNIVTTPPSAAQVKDIGVNEDQDDDDDDDDDDAADDDENNDADDNDD